MEKNITGKNIIRNTQAFFAFVLGMYIAPAYSCPTCVGRLNAQSPAFFAQDYANSPETQAGGSSQTNAAFLFNRQRNPAANVPLLEESDSTDSTGETNDTGSSSSRSSNTSSSSARQSSNQTQKSLPSKNK
jgi:hypothetical protein